MLCWRILLSLPVLVALGSVAPALAQPTADAGPNQTLECSGAETEAQLDGSGSVGDDLDYLWTGDAIADQAPVVGVMPTVVLPPGEHEIQLEVTDASGAMDTDSVVVTVADSEPPVIELRSDSRELWPPNHDLDDISVRQAVRRVRDTCDSDVSLRDVLFTRVSSDEEENGRGDGNTDDDIRIARDCRKIEVRAERAGPGDGRVYRAILEARDAAGNVGEAELTVKVPHDRGRGSEAVDSGEVYAVEGVCEDTDFEDLCPAEPVRGCFEAGVADLKIRNGPRDRRDGLVWKAGDFGPGAADFGDPTDDTDYQLCLYVFEGDGGSLDADPRIPAGSGWRALRSGFRYAARRGKSVDGIQRALLRERRDSAQVFVKGRGPKLDPPSLPIPGDGRLRAELHNADGSCWGVTFSVPQRNDERSYRARVR